MLLNLAGGKQPATEEQMHSYFPLDPGRRNTTTLQNLVTMVAFLVEVLCKIILTDLSVQHHAQNGQDGSTLRIKENY